MGTLKPGATYIYERADGVTYAREFGADPSTRQAIGWEFDESSVHWSLRKQAEDEALWKEIRAASWTNPAIKDALDRVKELYLLTKDHK